MHISKIGQNTSPTQQAMTELQHGYGHFNLELFNSLLPACLISLNRKGRRTLGYFSPDRFRANANGAKTDEIALNPHHFKTDDPTRVLSTLVHETVHLWQANFGKGSRCSYHNKQWAAKMQEIGLMPSNTGLPGGKVTGNQMHHYVIENGPFHQSVNRLIASGFSLTWYDITADFDRQPSLVIADPTKRGPVKTPSGTRRRFICPNCNAKAYGKGSLNLICGDCKMRMA